MKMQKKFENYSLVHRGGLIRMRMGSMCLSALERFSAFCAILVLSPVIGLTALLVLCLQGTPLFYSGERIGRYGSTFRIHKFRTLAVDAEVSLKGSVLGARNNLETPLGRFLRATRIDELPQLWNIAAGEMSFFGPRPTRRAVLAEQGGNGVADVLAAPPFKPGLIGPVQLYMPHGASKRIRFAFLRRHYLSASRRSGQAGLMLLCGSALALKALELGRATAGRMRQTRRADMRKGYRIVPRHRVSVFAGDATGKYYFIGNVRDIDDHAFSLDNRVAQVVPGQILLFTTRARRGRRVRVLHIRARVESVASIPSDTSNGEPRLLVFFKIDRDAGRYFVERYILRKSIL